MKRVFVQSTDNQRGQDGLIPQLYVHAPTQTAFVPITGSFSVEKPKHEAAIVTVHFYRETYLLYLFILVSYMPFLTCHFVNS